MLASSDLCLALLRCPRTGLALRRHDDTLVTCATEAQQHHEYFLINDMPVLIDFDRSVLDQSRVLDTAARSPVELSSYRGFKAIAHHLVSPESDRTKENVATLISIVKSANIKPRVLIIGGGTVGQGVRELYDDQGIDLICFDIYYSQNIQFIADAHNLPLADECLDAIVIQAVLEHVVAPHVVVSEIFRTLKPGGIVYAETPFMQHVHSGAYDFTRFTDSGHRFLFKRFALIRSGSIGGVGSQLLWSLDFFFTGLFRSRNAGRIAKLIFFWLRYVDLMVPEKFSIDAACGVFFLGRKTDAEMTPKEIIAYYRGAQ